MRIKIRSRVPTVSSRASSWRSAPGMPAMSSRSSGSMAHGSMTSSTSVLLFGTRVARARVPSTSLMETLRSTLWLSSTSKHEIDLVVEFF